MSHTILPASANARSIRIGNITSAPQRPGLLRVGGANTRLGLHVTTNELAIWQTRSVSGPYKTAGDVSTNSPGDWDHIKAQADALVATPTMDRWNGTGFTVDGGG
jgi:hypothetical protein